MAVDLTQLIVVVFLFFASVLSSPVPHFKGSCRHGILHILSCKDEPTNTESIGISDELLHRFELIADYATAAYCPGNNDSPGTQLTCPVHNCPLVEAANATTITEFQNSKLTDNTGFLAVDLVNKMVILAFRGSVSRLNWNIDTQMIRKPTGWCEKCSVHEGFWEAWQEVKPTVMDTVKKAVAAFPDYRFVITGHSLGGALATLAAGDIRQIDERFLDITELVSFCLIPPSFLSNPPAPLFSLIFQITKLASNPPQYTFGSPRIGNTHTATFLSLQSALSYRVTSVDDPVPRLPGVILGYMHTSPEYWISKHPDNPTAHDIHALTGYYNSKGNSGTHWWKGESHRHYFGHMTLCAPEKNKEGKRWLDGGNGNGTGVGDGEMAWRLMEPHFNESMLMREEGERGWNVTFPVGSVGDAVAEAVHGPKREGEELGATVVRFGQGGWGR
ncbi:hypothetical protein MMC24_005521 [Lignoscripta atroalba]|nr:hypothetical protein [Lignoscripta atroalba]